MSRYFRIFLILAACSLSIPASCVFSDTIYTNNDREMKGIVVEDYKDRIVMSTVDGEITVPKTEIKQMFYDNEADNL